jgi:hypothetical protein
MADPDPLPGRRRGEEHDKDRTVETLCAYQFLPL